MISLQFALRVRFRICGLSDDFAWCETQKKIAKPKGRELIGEDKTSTKGQRRLNIVSGIQTDSLTG